MTTQVRPYSKDLLYALRMRDVPGPRIAEVLAEVDSHVRETGEDPREAFGALRQYAAEVSAALGVRVKPLWRTVLSWTTARYALGGSAGSWFFLDGALAALAHERGALGLPAASVVLGAAILLAMAVGLVRLTRRPDTQVLDPRSGADMTPPVPRWVLPMMVAVPVVPFVLVVVVVIAQR